MVLFRKVFIFSFSSFFLYCWTPLGSKMPLSFVSSYLCFHSCINILLFHVNHFIIYTPSFLSPFLLYLYFCPCFKTILSFFSLVSIHFPFFYHFLFDSSSPTFSSSSPSSTSKPQQWTKTTWSINISSSHTKFRGAKNPNLNREWNLFLVIHWLGKRNKLLKR